MIKRVDVINETKMLQSKRREERLLSFYLNNRAVVSYVLDVMTFKDVKKRLSAGKVGVLAIGDDKNHRIDLNQVDRIKIDGEFI